MLEFQPVTWEDLEQIRYWIARTGSRGCTFSVGNQYIWNTDGKLEYAIYQNHILYRAVYPDGVTYRIPDRNKMDSEAIREMIGAIRKDSETFSGKFTIADMDRENVEELERSFPGEFEIIYDRDACDYVYEVQNLIALSGKKYHSKKNHINRFQKNYEYQYEVLTPEHFCQCRKVATEWLEKRMEQDAVPNVAQKVAQNLPEEQLLLQQMLHEQQALDNAFRWYEKLGFCGGVICMDGEVQAFTLGERMSEELFVIHFEKARDIPGLYPIIHWEFARNELQSYRYVNREEDLGLEGLRKAKLSYHPAFLVDKYRAVQKTKG